MPFIVSPKDTPCTSRTPQQKQQALTRRSLHPAADLKHGGGAEQEEEAEAADAAHHQHHGHADQEGGGLERGGRDGRELGEAALARQLPGYAVPGAEVEEAEVAGLRRVHAIADPVGLREDRHVDHGQQDGEDGPQQPDHT